jgi:hypothetical protein
MQSMDSAKPVLPVALADELLGTGWRRPRKAVRTVAVVCALLAAAAVFGLFNRFRVQQGEAKPERQLVATIDLSIGNPVVAAGRGEAQARLDIEAGLLQFKTFGPALTKADTAKALRLKQRHGVTWVHKAEAATPVTDAYADGYNRAMQAEIERRHGAEVLRRVMREFDAGAAAQDKKDSP